MYHVRPQRSISMNIHHQHHNRVRPCSNQYIPFVPFTGLRDFCNRWALSRPGLRVYFLIVIPLSLSHYISDLRSSTIESVGVQCLWNPLIVV